MIRLVQCWDDGVEDDIRLTELLRRCGAKATFNLNPGMHQSERCGNWRYRDQKVVRKLALGELTSVYAGFVIANHTLTHPHPTEISHAQWRREVEDGRKRLQDWFSAPVLGFAYPFGEADETTAQVVREAGHAYGRVTDDHRVGMNSDLMRYAPDCHVLAANFWTLYQEAKKCGAAVFYFWGHSYELLTDADWIALEHKMQRLSADPEAQWADLPDALVATHNV